MKNFCHIHIAILNGASGWYRRFIVGSRDDADNKERFDVALHILGYIVVTGVVICWWGGEQWLKESMSPISVTCFLLDQMEVSN